MVGLKLVSVWIYYAVIIASFVAVLFIFCMNYCLRQGLRSELKRNLKNDFPAQNPDFAPKVVQVWCLLHFVTFLNV